jgi:hypothetical protein
MVRAACNVMSALFTPAYNVQARRHLARFCLFVHPSDGVTRRSVFTPGRRS